MGIVSKIVMSEKIKEMTAGTKGMIVIFDQAGNGQGRPNPVNGAPKIDFKARAAALKASKMRNMHVVVKNATSKTRQPR